MPVIPRSGFDFFVFESDLIHAMSNEIGSRIDNTRKIMITN
jgi:hypothetical protein